MDLELIRGRQRWYRHVERKDVDDWMSACRNAEVEGQGQRSEELERMCGGEHE